MMAVTRRSFMGGGLVLAAAVLAERTLPTSDLFDLQDRIAELDLFSLEVGQPVTITVQHVGIAGESFLVSKIVDDVQAGTRALKFTRIDGRLAEVFLTVNR